MDLVKKLINDQSGQGLVEYALIIAFIAILLIGALGLVKGGIENSFTDISTILNS